MSLCCASCRARRSEGPTLVHTLVNPSFPHAKPMPTCTLAHMLHLMQDSCQLWARLVLARMLHPMQNPCQPWTWHECCNTSKTRANIGHARVVPIVIHRLSTGYPQVALCNTRATSNVGTDVATQEACQLLDKC